MKAEGYKVDNLPADEKAFENLLISQGAIFSPYAEGAFDDYLKNGKPLLIEKSDYESWAKQSMPAASYEEVITQYGDAPGSYMAVNKNDKQYVAVAAIQLENITLLPQPMAGLGRDAFEVVHGAKMPPPHSYIAPICGHNPVSKPCNGAFGTHAVGVYTAEASGSQQLRLERYTCRQRAALLLLYHWKYWRKCDGETSFVCNIDILHYTGFQRNQNPHTI